MNPVLLPKEDPELPDHYGADIFYITGGSEKIEVASHAILKNAEVFEILTKDDEWVLLPLAGIKKIVLDKRWSKVVAIRAKQLEGKK